MNWQLILKTLKGEGYAGADNDLSAVEQFIADNTIELESKGKAVDIKASHAKAFPSARKIDLTEADAEAEIERKAQARAAELHEESQKLLGKGKGRNAGDGADIEIKVGKTLLADDPYMGYGKGGMHNYFLDVLKAGGNASGPGRPEKGSKLEIFQKASLSSYANENIGADGGFAVPETVDNNIRSRVLGEESLLSRTDRITVAGNQYTETRDETTVWGSAGIQAAWEGEGGTIAQSKPVLNQKTWQLNKVAALVPITSEAKVDGVALASHINSKAPAMIDFKVGEAIIRGTGAGMPVGILNSSGTLSISAESNQPADTYKATNAQKQLMRMYPAYARNGVFIMHPDVQVQLHELFVVAKTNAGTAIAAGGLVFNPQAQPGAPFGTLYGKPILFSQHCETLGDVGDVILADLGQYRSVLKSDGVQSMVSPHFWFDQDVDAMRFIFRMGGGPKFDTTISPRDGSNTMAAFLTVAAR